MTTETKENETMTTTSETLALEIVDNMKATPVKSWMSYYTTICVGRSYAAQVTKILKAWGVLVPTHTGNYTVNYDATVFSN